MSMNEKVSVEIARRRLEVEIEGLTPMEITIIANMVNEKLDEAQRLNQKVADTSKLAIYALLYMGAELYRLQQAESTNRKALENTLDHIGKSLQEALDAARVPAQDG
ncbi:MAG: cell division protein ZapA [Elusimicrobia bacterium]|nr:cell division protein ZapA [Elusimicrobiota bacterium]